MSSLKEGIKTIRKRLEGGEIFALVMVILGALFMAWGIYRFHLRPAPFGWVGILGCLVGALIAFFLLLVTDYVFHHAILVFIPWFICLIYFALINPYFAVGIGLALWGMLASQLSG